VLCSLKKSQSCGKTVQVVFTPTFFAGGENFDRASDEKFGENVQKLVTKLSERKNVSEFIEEEFALV